MPIAITHTVRHLNLDKPTIYTALRDKLGREPTHNELVADVQRILTETTIKLAEQGKLSWQRKRA